MPVVNPDRSPEGMPLPDTESEQEAMPEWDSAPESPPMRPLPTTPPEMFRTLPHMRILDRDGQPMADAPSPEEYTEWEGSPEWTTHDLPVVSDFAD